MLLIHSHVRPESRILLKDLLKDPPSELNTKTYENAPIEMDLNIHKLRYKPFNMSVYTYIYMIVYVCVHQFKILL